MRHSLNLLVLLLVGCGGPEVTRLTGRVLLDEQPLSEVSVCFWPANDIYLGIMVSYAPLADGSFEIQPEVERGQGRAGAYNVIVTENDFTRAIMPRFPRKYGDPKQTPFSVAIPKGESELETFCLVSDAETRAANLAIEMLRAKGIKIPLLDREPEPKN